MESDPGSSTYKTFVCHICGRIFIRHHRLQSHIRTHNKRKLSFTSVGKDNAPSTEGPTEHKTKSSTKEIETSSAVEQSGSLENATDHYKKFDECASTSPETNDSSSSQNCLTVEDNSSTTLPRMEDTIKYSSRKNLTNTKNRVLDKKTSKLTKIQQYPTGEVFEPKNAKMFITACDVDVIISEYNISGTEIANEVETKTTDEVHTETTFEVKREVVAKGPATSPTSRLPKRPKVNYVCDACPRTFSNKAHYERHVLIHTKEKPHKCPVCSKCFTQVGNLNAHHRMHYEGQRTTLDSQQRNNVDQSEINPDSITLTFPKGRKSRVRSKESVFYSCEECGMQFSSKCYLERHALTHTKEKPHICNVCFRGFAQIGNLNVHYRTHTNLKTFVCHVCDKAFTLMGSLKAHLLTHMEQKPFECDVCGKGFSSKCFLKRHYLTHTNFKPHVCSVCQRGFVQVGNLNVHLLTHLNQNSFKCDVCEKTFARKLYLDRHYKNHTNGKEVYSNENNIEFSMENDNE